MRSSLVKTLALSIAAIGMAPSAFAVLDRAGPVDAVNGFPQWYADKNGVALELCINIDPAVLAAGGCAILPAAPPNGVLTVPEVFPANWSTEHFYTLASVKLQSAGLDKLTRTPISGAGGIVFNMGLEASFATGIPTPGTQITFNRWRVTHTNVGCTGNYTYYTPNNAPQTFAGAEGGKVFETSDVGIGTFTGPLAGSTGPFLQWSDVPGGTVKAPFIGPDGKKYIADYGAVGTPVTGRTCPTRCARAPRRGSRLRSRRCRLPTTCWSKGLALRRVTARRPKPSTRQPVSTCSAVTSKASCLRSTRWSAPRTRRWLL
jgi:hypothetical protein